MIKKLLKPEKYRFYPEHEHHGRTVGYNKSYIWIKNGNSFVSQRLSQKFEISFLRWPNYFEVNAIKCESKFETTWSFAW